MSRIDPEMRRTLAAIPSPLIVFDEHTDQICYANAAAQALFAFRGEQPPVRWSNLRVGEDAYRQSVLAPVLMENEQQGQYRRVDGRVFWGVVAFSSLPPADSGLRLALTVVRRLVAGRVG